MTAAALLDRVVAAGAAASLDLDGRVRIAGASRLPAGLLDQLRQNRTEVVAALARREVDPHDVAERSAMAEHYAAAPSARPWRPGDPDPLRDGLLAGWRASRSGRLFALAQRLKAVRPLRSWGVRELDRQAWQDAAREAAGLPSAEWTSWRAAVGTAATAWPQRGTTDRNNFARAGDHGP